MRRACVRLLLIIVVGLSACTPAAPVGVVTPSSSEPPTVIRTAVPSAAGRIEDAVVFIIPNEEPFSGREGDPRPDWLGWGAGALDVAPDGSFWIADTAAAPQRLLHYTPYGVQLDEISLEGVAKSIQDIAAGVGELWLLDYNASEIRVIKLGLDLRQNEIFSVPAELYSHNGTPVANGIFSLQMAPDGGLVIGGISGLTLLVNAAGREVDTHLSGWSANGHIYRSSADTAEGLSNLVIDGRPIPMGGSLSLEAEPFLGFNPDGTFPIVLRREASAAAGAEAAVDWMVAHVREDGTVIGYAGLPQRMPWQAFNHELALGPDGHVYALFSKADHSVEIVRLGFGPDRPTPPVVPPPATTTPLTPLRSVTSQPLATVPAEAVDAANALLAFFSDLERARYQAADEIYGGTFDELGGPQPAQDGADSDATWGQICQQFLCLPIAAITNVVQSGPGSFTFDVVFTWPDGQRVEIGACCGGNPAASPPVWKFAYTVAFQNGGWKVLRGPLYLP